MKNCIAVTNSMTTALGGQRALSAAAIRATVIKLDASQTSRGCAYGLEFSCAQLRNVKTILNAQHIAVKDYIGGEENGLS